MTKVVVDAAFGEKLTGLTGAVELCDESGRTLGYFQPVLSEGLSAKGIRSPISDEVHGPLDVPGGRPAYGDLASCAGSQEDHVCCAGDRRNAARGSARAWRISQRHEANHVRPAPLGIDFNVLEEDRLVYVLGVWTIQDT